MKHIMRLIKPNTSAKFELEFDDVDGALTKQLQMTLIGPIIPKKPEIERHEIGVVSKEDVKELARAIGR